MCSEAASVLTFVSSERFANFDTRTSLQWLHHVRLELQKREWCNKRLERLTRPSEFAPTYSEHGRALQRLLFQKFT